MSTVRDTFESWPSNIRQENPLLGRIFYNFGVEEESSTVLNSFSPIFWGRGRWFWVVFSILWGPLLQSNKQIVSQALWDIIKASNTLNCSLSCKQLVFHDSVHIFTILNLSINIYRSVEKIIDCSITGLLSCPKSNRLRWFA